jgi:hypothetical protein
VADVELLAGDAVRGADVGRAVIGHHALDGDAVRGEERDRALQKADRGRGLLVVENLGERDAGVVIDRDVQELPAELPAPGPGGVPRPEPCSSPRRAIIGLTPISHSGPHSRDRRAATRPGKERLDDLT